MAHGTKLLDLLELNPHLRDGNFDKAIEKLNTTPDGWLYAEWRISEYVLFLITIKLERNATATVKLSRIDVPVAKEHFAVFYETESLSAALNMWPEMRKFEWFIGVGSDLSAYKSTKNGRPYKEGTCESRVVI